MDYKVNGTSNMATSFVSKSRDINSTQGKSLMDAKSKYGRSAKSQYSNYEDRAANPNMRFAGLP